MKVQSVMRWPNRPCDLAVDFWVVCAAYQIVDGDIEVVSQGDEIAGSRFTIRFWSIDL